MEKSMLDVAYELLKKNGKPMSFFDMMKAVAAGEGISEDEMKSKMSQFYTNLSIDGRFVVLADNFWDLRERVPFEKVHIDMNDAYNDIDDDSDDEDEEKSDSGDEEKAKELGEDETDANGEDNYDEEADESNEDEKADEVKKELGV
jgi:DNA-directed RNA polymerase subunit delta